MVTVYVPTPFRRATYNKDRVTVEGDSVGEVLNDLEQTYEGLRGLIRTEAGEIHPHVNIYVNSEAIEALDGLGTRVKDGDELTIIPALAGGAGSAWA
jgi:molybdopterin synthase sulfur carrier subunit